MKRLAALALALLLSGCGVTAALQGAGQQIGPTVMAIDSDIYAVAVAKYQAAQMFKAQIDGTIQLPPLPPPPLPPGPPVVVNPPGGGTVVVMPPGSIQPPPPVPVPSLQQQRRHAALDRQSVDQAVYDHTPARDTPAMGPGPSGVPDKRGAQTGKPANFQFECSSTSCALAPPRLDRQSVDQGARSTGTLTPPSDLRALFGPDGHLKQITGL